MCYGPKRLIAGRSPLRLATFSLPTHREVVAAAFRISALGAPLQRSPRLPCVPCCVSAFPRRRDQTNQLLMTEQLHKSEAIVTMHLCTAASCHPGSSDQVGALMSRATGRRRRICPTSTSGPNGTDSSASKASAKLPCRSGGIRRRVPLRHKVEMLRKSLLPKSCAVSRQNRVMAA